MAKETKYFVESHKNAVINATYGQAVLPSVAMAIAVEESNSGNEDCTLICNNHYWLKPQPNDLAREIDGKSVKLYNDPYACFKDFLAELAESEEVKESGALRAKKPNTQLEKLEVGLGKYEGWAEDVLKIVEDFELEKLDQEAEEIHKAWKAKTAQ